MKGSHKNDFVLLFDLYVELNAIVVCLKLTGKRMLARNLFLNWTFLLVTKRVYHAGDMSDIEEYFCYVCYVCQGLFGPENFLSWIQRNICNCHNVLIFLQKFWDGLEYVHNCIG